MHKSLTDCVLAIKKQKEQIEEIRANQAKTMDGLCWELEELNRTHAMLLDGVDTTKVVLGEHVLSIQMSGALAGDDIDAINDAIIDLVEFKGKRLKTEFTSTKNYDGWNHQGVGWTKYGYGPKHGSTVFAVGMTTPLREDPERVLTTDEVEAAVYLLEMLKVGKYKAAK